MSDPLWKKMERAAEIARHQTRLQTVRERGRNITVSDGNYSHREKPVAAAKARDVLERLAERPVDTRTAAQRFLGDPLPGRSALDREQRK